MNDSTTQQLNEVAISVKNLSKSYKMYPSPKELLKERLHPFGKKYHKDFWALKDVSFEVKKGECVGIIGMNGSGKSTLLQLLCGILQPTEGEVKVNGRISALLELGAGFNPEFTGRQNVYINGALMGFNRWEMDERFDAIASFADIGEFIEQPVKTYSSGMYVRLAFACVVNVDPDILIVDEALAVGDARFQKKCFDRMNSFREDRGKTIIVVSHDIGTIKTFPSKGILIDKGEIIHNGDPREVVLKYMQMMFPEVVKSQKDNQVSISTDDVPEETPADELVSNIRDGYCLEIVPQEVGTEKTFGAGGAWINWVKIFGLQEPNIFYGGEELEVQISFGWDKAQIEHIRHQEDLPNNLIVGCGLDNYKGVTIFGFHSIDKGYHIDPSQNKTGFISFEIVLPDMMGGGYFMYPAIALGTQEHHTQLRWYNNMIHLECLPNKKYIYGVVKLNYRIKELRN